MPVPLLLLLSYVAQFGENLLPMMPASVLLLGCM
jgi:hypothetical protein